MIRALTFKQELWIMAGTVLCGLLLTSFFKQGVFSNIGWVIAGLLPIVHPVCPESWKWKYGDDDKRIKRGFRIGGAVVIFIGLMTRFGP